MSLSLTFGLDTSSIVQADASRLTAWPKYRAAERWDSIVSNRRSDSLCIDIALDLAL